MIFLRITLVVVLLSLEFSRIRRLKMVLSYLSVLFIVKRGLEEIVILNVTRGVLAWGRVKLCLGRTREEGL